MDPAKHALWWEFHYSRADVASGHTTDFYSGDNEVQCRMCDRILRTVFGTIEEDEATEKWNYEEEFWWADGESEVLCNYFTGDAKNWSDEQYREHVIAGAKKRLEQDAGLPDGHVRAEARRYKTVTYKRNAEVLWKSGEDVPVIKSE